MKTKETLIKSLCLAGIMLLLGTTSNAQYYFQKLYDNNDGKQKLLQDVLSYKGNLVAPGTIPENGLYELALTNGSVMIGKSWPSEKGYIIKTQANGDIQWSKTMDNLSPTNIIELFNGKIAVTGDVLQGGAFSKEFVMVLDQNGTADWQIALDGNQNDAHITRANNGNILFASTIGGSPYNDLFVAEFSASSGSKLWHRVYKFRYNEQSQFRVMDLITYDGNYYVLGDHASENVSWAAKFDAQFNLSWLKYYEVENHDLRFDRVAGFDGKLFIGGITKPQGTDRLSLSSIWANSGNPIIHTEYTAFSDFFGPELETIAGGVYITADIGSSTIAGLKTDTLGGLLVQKQYDSRSYERADITHVSELQSLGAYVASTAETDKFTLIKTNLDLDNCDEQDLDLTTEHPSLEDIAVEVEEIEEEIIINELEFSYTSDFTVELLCDYGGGIIQFPGTGFQVVPNPSNGIFHIELSEPAHPQTYLSLFDFSGELVQESEVPEGQIAYEVSGVTPGLYIAKVAVGENSAEKIVIVE